MKNEMKKIAFIHPDNLFIDRISLTYDVASEDHKKYLLAAVKEKGWLDTWTDKKASKSSYQYNVSRSLTLPDKDFEQDNVAILELDPRYTSTPFLRLDYNPHKISYLGLETCLESVLPFDLADIYEAGGVSRVDIAMDIVGVNPMQVVLDYQKTRHRANYIESGALETVYIGTDTGVNQLVMYDKVAEMKAKKLKIKPMSDYQFPTTSITRIEMRHRPKITKTNKIKKFNQMHKLQNLFAPMFIILTPRYIKKDTDLRHNRDLCVLKGLRHTANELTKQERAAFAEKVEQQWLPDFLDLKKLWSTLPQALQQVYPDAKFV
jgi:hypothetical protein